MGLGGFLRVFGGFWRLGLFRVSLVLLGVFGS